MIKHAFDSAALDQNSENNIRFTPMAHRAGVSHETWVSPGLGQLYRLSPATPLPDERHDLHELAWAVSLSLTGQLPALTCRAVGGQLQLVEFSGFIADQRDVQCIRVLVTSRLNQRGETVLTLSLPDEIVPPMQSRVLLVEDDPQVGFLLCRLLRRSGFEAIWLDRGVNVVTVAAEQQPEVIVLDVDLPDADGITLGHQLQSQVGTKFIPLLFCSGNDAARAAALQLGAKDFLEKPLELIQLPQRLRAILGHGSKP